jgi:hypothetical protein
MFGTKPRFTGQTRPETISVIVSGCITVLSSWRLSLAARRVLEGEKISTVEKKVVHLDGSPYKVLLVKHIQNGAYNLELRHTKGEGMMWVDVLVENGEIIYVDY